MRFVWCILSGNKDAFIRLPGNLKGILPSYLKEDREKYSKEVKIFDTVLNKSGFKESWTGYWYRRSSTILFISSPRSQKIKNLGQTNSTPDQTKLSID